VSGVRKSLKEKEMKAENNEPPEMEFDKGHLL
jgi:hypothetical protein